MVVGGTCVQTLEQPKTHTHTHTYTQKNDVSRLHPSVFIIGISDYAEIVEDEGDYSSPDGEFSGETTAKDKKQVEDFTKRLSESQIYLRV